jgi:hypothetical protein
MTRRADSMVAPRLLCLPESQSVRQAAHSDP